MDNGIRPLEEFEVRLQKAFDTVRQTREMIATSKQEIADTQRTIRNSQESIAASLKRLKDRVAMADIC